MFVPLLKGQLKKYPPYLVNDPNIDGLIEPRSHEKGWCLTRNFGILLTKAFFPFTYRHNQRSSQHPQYPGPTVCWRNTTWFPADL